MNKISLLIILLLLTIIGFGAYKFIYQDTVVHSDDDGRLAIQLTFDEKKLILDEMRTFLANTQIIIQAVSNDDLSNAIIAAKKVGLAAQEAVPDSLVGKLPLAFKELGLDTHKKFDELAMDAEDMDDKEQTLKLLAELLNNCIACHAAYRLENEQPKNIL